MDPSLPAIPLTRPTTDQRELDAVAEVLESGWLAGQGPRGTELERAFAELSGRAHAVAVNNCTAGLHLSLSALGVGPGDEVLVADYTLPRHGARCALLRRHAALRRRTTRHRHLDLDCAAERHHRRAPAGSSASMRWASRPTGTPLESLAQRARSLPARGRRLLGRRRRIDGRPCGAFGDVAVFSLHARKGITSGEGGVVVTDDAEIAERVRRASCFGMRSAFARQGSGQLEIPEFDRARLQLQALRHPGRHRARPAREARWLHGRDAAPSPTAMPTLLAGVPGIRAPRSPTTASRPGRRTPSRWTTMSTATPPCSACAPAGSARRSAPTPCTARRCTTRRATAHGLDELFRRHLALPMYADLTDADQDRVVSALGEVLTTAA